MNCTEARDAMLIADVAELRGEGSTTLAAHIATCAECRETAAMLGGSTAALAGRIDRQRTSALKRTPRIVATTSVAAAAAIVAVVAMRQRDARRETTVATRALPSLPVARQVSLEVGRGQRATVLKTNDPKVTVIWLSSGEGK